MRNKHRLREIYQKTDGYCHLCHRKLSFYNYGNKNSKGAWHIEHSIPRAKGGTDHMNNLFPACVCCNHEKGVLHTTTIRRRNGVSRAPYSRDKKERIKEENMIGGAVGGGLIGLSFGPVGMLVGAIVGGFIGEDISPNR